MGVYKEGKNWKVQVYYKDWQGNQKRKQKRGFRTKGEAKEWERDFLQQRLAELLSLVIGKSQAHAPPLNMTTLVLLVTLYRASFWFARGAEKKTLIKRSAVFQKETLEFR